MPFRKSGRTGEKGIYIFLFGLIRVRTFGINLEQLVLKRTAVFHFIRLFYDYVCGDLLDTVE